MFWLRLIYTRLYGLLRKNRIEQEMEEELRFHLRMRSLENIERGMEPDEAEREARRRFGNVGRIKDLGRDIKGGGFIETLLQDLRYGARVLMKQPGFTLIISLTLALGIGANTAMFSLLDAMLLRPLPGVDAERIVQIGEAEIDTGKGFGSLAYPDYRDYRDQNSTLTGIAALSELPFHLGTDKIAERVSGAMVSGNYFEVFGVRAAQGRLLQASDDEVEGANPVAVISERLWRNQLGAEQVMGKTISLNSYPFTIIGVVAEFNGTSRNKERTDVWVPITMWRQSDPSTAGIGIDLLNNRLSNFGQHYGRLKPGVTIEQAQADLSTIAGRLRKIYPETNVGRGVRVLAGFDMSPGDRREIRFLIGVLFGVVAIVLLIACANVAGLMLARTSARRKEMGIRIAVGAGRLRLARQLLTESAMLAMLGGALAIVVAFWLMYGIRASLPGEFRDVWWQIGFVPDWRVLSFTLGLSIATGFLFGLAPALQSSKPDVLPALKDSGGSLSHRSGGRLRSALVVTQIALSLVLLISAGLCVRTLQNLQAINLGFEAANVLTAKLDLGRQNYSEAQGREFYQRLLERVQSLPGVQAASLALNVPLSKSGWGGAVFVDNQPLFSIPYHIVTPGYLDTMGIPLSLGRQFTEQDDARSSRVTIINETFARQVWPNENPIGQLFRVPISKGNQMVEVIGVARDAKAFILEDDTARAAYFPLAQQYNDGMTLHLRTTTKPEQLIAAVRQEIRALDPKLPIYGVKTLEQYQRDYLFKKRFQAALIGGFGLLALALASLGLYGALSFSVAQRTQEIGIRMALGARTGDVLRLVVGQGVRLISIGLALGLAGAFAAARVLKNLLYGVGLTDPLTFVGIPLLLLVVALLACWIPARRATKVDPMMTLRSE
jgi:putative ABC transport system permease protein